MCFQRLKGIFHILVKKLSIIYLSNYLSTYLPFVFFYLFLFIFFLSFSVCVGLGISYGLCNAHATFTLQQKNCFPISSLLR